MASITSAGIGSGLDVTSLVAQLVAAERAPAQNRLSTAKAGVQLQISALGTYRAAMAALQSAVDSLKKDGSVAKLSATSSDPDVFGASVGSGAVAGSYDIEVVALAQAHKLVSDPYANAAASVGTDPVIITVGGSTFQVQLSSGADTLADLRDAINDASDNAGVTATLVNEAGGTRLLLTSKNVGSASSISVTGITTTQKQAASDAHIIVEGYDRYASTNTISDAIDGITLDLKKAKPGETLSLKVAVDTSAGSAAITNFVAAYNKAMQTVGQLSKYDAAAKTGGPLMGDAAVRGMTRQLRELVGGRIDAGGAYFMLSQLGISTATDGTLTIDSSKLGAALKDDQVGAQKLFSADNGLATRLSTILKSFLGDDGQLDAETDGLQSRLTDIGKQQTTLDRRMSMLEARYKAQFTALDSLIGQLRSTSDYLSRQLASLSSS